jgi:hypothetical protein
VIVQIDQDVAIEPGWLDRVADCCWIRAWARCRALHHPRDSFFARVMALDLEQRYDCLATDVDHVCTGNTAYRVGSGSAPERASRLRHIMT